MLKDLDIDLPANLPSNKDDLFCFSFNFENLIKTIDYLHKYNLALFSKLQNLNERMAKFESETSEELKKVKTITEENKSKIDEVGGKLNEANNDIEDLKKDIIKNEEKIGLILTYENNKNINENEEQENNANSDNDKINKNNFQKFLSENAFKKSDDNEIDLLKYNVSKINDKIKEIETNINNNQNLLNNQTENNLSNIINSIEKNGNQGEIDPNLLNIIVSHIDKEKQNNQIIFNKFNTNQEKIKQELTSLHNKFLENKNNFNSVQKLLDEYSRNKDKFLTFKDIKDLSKNIDMISSKLKEFSKKQDLEILKKDINSKIQEIKKKEIIIQSKDDKHGNAEESGEADGTINKNISELISDLLKSEGKNIDISKNKHFVELMKQNKQNSKELNKNLRNFFDLKKQLSSDHTQNEISELKTEYIDLNEEFKVYKQKLLNLIKMIGDYETKKEEDEEDEKYGKNDDISVEKKLKQTEETITGKIEFLVQCVEKLNDKFEKIDKKLGTITKEVKDDIKAAIRVDTYKVVEQFKLKLSSFTEKFENELKNKIDKIGLNIFETKLNNKLSLNLKDKLNKNDLKKNNYIISKKIDTLENKISKTLVDTIIDLQMDDAPLIVKKNQRNVELCVSCNRPLETISKTIEQIPINTSPNINSVTTPRTQVKNIVCLKKLPIINSPK